MWRNGELISWEEAGIFMFMGGSSEADPSLLEGGSIPAASQSAMVPNYSEKNSQGVPCSPKTGDVDEELATKIREQYSFGMSVPFIVGGVLLSILSVIAVFKVIRSPSETVVKRVGYAIALALIAVNIYFSIVSRIKFGKGRDAERAR